MKPRRFSQNVYLFSRFSHLRRFHHSQRRTLSSFLNNIRSNHFGTRASSLGGGSNGGGGSGLEIPKIEEKRERGIELEFHPDVKTSLLEILPLRSISRAWEERKHKT